MFGLEVTVVFEIGVFVSKISGKTGISQKFLAEIKFSSQSFEYDVLNTALERHSQMDPWRRVFPEFPKKPFPPAHIQYEPGTELNLKPHSTHPHGAVTNVQLRVTKLFKYGHERVSQVLRCFVTTGPSSIRGIELVAYAYDCRYAPAEDFMEITSNGIIIALEFTVLMIR